MHESQLVLSIPQGVTTATSLGIDGRALHYSPGSGKHFKGRKLFVELVCWSFLRFLDVFLLGHI